MGDGGPGPEARPTNWAGVVGQPGEVSAAGSGGGAAQSASRVARGRGLLVSAALFAVLIAALVGLVAVGAPLLFHHGSPGGGGSSVLPPPTCVGNATNGPSSFIISSPNPAVNAPSGSQLSVSYEVRALVSGAGTASIKVDVPTVTAVFPTEGGGSITIQVGPHVLAAALSAWSDPNATSHSRTLNSSTVFQSNASAYLSTSKIAVSAPTPFGSFALEVRWQWVLTPTGGAPVVGPWTVPTAQGSSPSEFYPAAAVTLVGSSGTNATIGWNFTLALSGAAPSESFVIKLENVTTGGDLRDSSAVAPSAAGAPFNASVLVLGTSGALVPGKYIIHLHDACNALLLSLPITAHYTQKASVGVHVAPSVCGPVQIDGTAYLDNSSWSGSPSPTSHPIVAPTCAAMAFKGWVTSGAVSVASAGAASTSAVFSGSGALGARFS